MKDTFLVTAEDLFMDAALEPELWPAALEFVGGECGSRGAGLLAVEGRGPFVLHTEGIGRIAERYVAEGWNLNDYRRASIPIFKRRGIATDLDIISPNEMKRLPYYADFLASEGLPWFAAMRIDTGADVWGATFYRSGAEGPYDFDDQQRLLRLQGPISRAATLARRLGYARLEGAADVADIASGAIAFVDAAGRIVRLNPAAESMVGQAFNLKNGRISFPHVSSAVVQRHIEAVIWSDLPSDATALQPVVVQRPDMRPLVLQAIPLRGLSSAVFAPAWAILLITDIDKDELPSAELLRRLFHLSPAEARVARALFVHFNIPAVAAKLNCGLETVRSHVKSIFEKTRTSSQAELVALLGRVKRGL